MRNYTIVMTSNTSEITTAIYPPLELDRTKEYHIGLLSLDTYNAIANISEGVNDMFEICYDQKGAKVCYAISIPQGSYDVADLQAAIIHGIEMAYKENAPDDSVPEPDFSLTVNPITNRVRMHSNWIVDFRAPRNFASLLGFDQKFYTGAHYAPNRTDINPNYIMSVECSLAKGAYKNGVRSHEVFQFSCDVPPGYILSKCPSNIIYYPLNTSVIDSVTVKIVDSKGRPVNFGGEELTIRLHIKQWE